MDWKQYQGKTVSILIVGKEDKTENYMGVIKCITDDNFIVLDTNNPNFTISEIIFRADLIKSVWVYK
mgnify:CR=1 FL=1